VDAEAEVGRVLAFAISMCNKKDVFSKKQGHKTAKTRLSRRPERRYLGLLTNEKDVLRNVVKAIKSLPTRRTEQDVIVAINEAII